MLNSFATSFSFKLAHDKLRYIIAAFILKFCCEFFTAITIVLFLPIFFSISNLNIIANNNFGILVKWSFVLNSWLDENSRLSILVTSFSFSLGIAVLFSYLSSINNLIHTKKLAFEIKKIVFDSLLNINLSYFHKNKIEDILLKITREIDRSIVTIKNSRKILIDLLVFLFFLTILVLISLRLTLIAAGLILILLIVNSLIGDYLKKKEILLFQKSQIYNRKTIECLTGIKHIKNCATEQKEFDSIIQALEARQKEEINFEATSYSIKLINKFLEIIVVLVLSISAYYLYFGQLQLLLPVLLVYLLILFKLLSTARQLNNLRIQYINNKSSIELINHFLSDIHKRDLKLDDKTFTGFENKISFQNLTFAYPHHAQIVLDKINLNIIKGNTIALVGYSGAGKSTLVNLLLRRYEPLEGKIIIDNQNITRYSIPSLSKSIAVVDQKPFLFNESILYNLTYGLENINEDEAIAAAKLTKAYDFILRLYDGFDSKIGNKKTVISEAEKQLIAITRALLLRPEIVILDEPLKKIAKSDRLIVQNAINELCRDRTNIIITNLFSTIKKADQIVILNKGKIIESGTHQELLKNGNFYKRMYSAQFKNSQKSHQQLLANKIYRKLASQTSNTLPDEIENNFNVLFNYLLLVDQSLTQDNLEQEKALDRSYQSAKDMLNSLREYQRKISEGFSNDL